MAFEICEKCVDFGCGDDTGLISIQWNTQGQVKSLGGDCDNPVNGEAGAQYVLGPVTGTVNLQAYAFNSESEDMWLGVRCSSKVQANQSNLMKYDGRTDQYYVLPSSNHSCQITGEYPEGVEMVTDCETQSFTSQLVAGSVTVGTAMRTVVGHELSFDGNPLPVSFPDKQPYTVLNTPNCFLSGFSLDIDYPNLPAKVSYTWQFILDCES